MAQPDRDMGVWGMAEYIESCIKALDVVCELLAATRLTFRGGCSAGRQCRCALQARGNGDTRANAITMMVCVLEPKPGDTEASSLGSHNGIALATAARAEKGVIEGSSLARGFAWVAAQRSSELCDHQLSAGRCPPSFDIFSGCRCDQPSSA